MITEADTIFAAPQVAEVQQAFDEERALAEIREQMVRKGAAKGEFQDAILPIGRQFIAARRAMPDVAGVSGRLTYGPAFLAFIEKSGLGRRTACIYMTYARNPKFYGGTFCVACSMHRPVGEFVWETDGSVVGS